MYKNISKTAPAALALAMALAMPAAAFADTSGGVSDTTQTTVSHTDMESGLEVATALTSLGVSASDGTWTDASKATHDNGKYCVTVPTNIRYTGVNAGHFDESGSYDINIAGVIRVADQVTATVTVGDFKNAISDNSDGDTATIPAGSAVRNPGGLTGTVTQGKTDWTCDELSVMEDDENGNAIVVGTTAQDSYSITGDVRNTNQFNASVQYNFTTSKPTM